MVFYYQAKSSVIVKPISAEYIMVIYSRKSACVISTSYFIGLIVSSVMEDNKR